MMFLPLPNMPHYIQRQQHIVCWLAVNYEGANNIFRHHENHVNELETDSETQGYQHLTFKCLPQLQMPSTDIVSYVSYYIIINYFLCASYSNIQQNQWSLLSQSTNVNGVGQPD